MKLSLSEENADLIKGFCCMAGIDRDVFTCSVILGSLQCIKDGFTPLEMKAMRTFKALPVIYEMNVHESVLNVFTACCELMGDELESFLSWHLLSGCDCLRYNVECLESSMDGKGFSEFEFQDVQGRVDDYFRLKFQLDKGLPLSFTGCTTFLYADLVC